VRGRRGWPPLSRSSDGQQLGDDVTGGVGAGERSHRLGHARAAGGILKDLVDQIAEPGRGRLSLRQDDRRAGALERQRVHRLVVVGGGRKGNQDRRPPHDRQLGQRQRAGARDAHGRLAQHRRHVVDERAHLHPSLVAERRVVDLHLVELVGAGLVNDGRQAPARVEDAHHPRGQLVDRTRALAAAQDHDGARVVRRRRAGGGAFEERPAHGIAEEADLAAGEAGGRVVERDEHAAHQPAQHAVGETRLAVLLLDRRRVAEQRGREHQRSRRVAAHAQHDVGAVAAQDAGRFEERARQPCQPAQQAPQAHALETADGHQLEREAGRRHQPGFQAARRADEHRLTAGGGPHLLGDRDARIEMTTRPAARDQQPQRATVRHQHLSTVAVARRGGACRRPRR